MIWLLLFFSTLSADSQHNHLVSGTIDSHFSLELRGLDAADTIELFSTVSDQEFEQGYIVIRNAIRLRRIYSNRPVYLYLQSNGWTLPADYDCHNGPKKLDGQDVQFRIKSRSVQAATGTIAPAGSSAHTFTAVSPTAQQILQIGHVGNGGELYGLKNGRAIWDSAILLNPTYDIPGTYVLDLELTISSQ